MAKASCNIFLLWVVLNCNFMFSSSKTCFSPPPTNLSFSSHNFHYEMTWSSSVGDESFKKFNGTYSLYQKFTTSTKWRRIENCQGIVTQYCRFELSYVTTDRLVAVIANQHNCPSKKSEAFVLISPPQEVRLSAPEFSVKSSKDQIFVYPRVDLSKESVMFEILDIKYQIEVGRSPITIESDVTLKTAELTATEIDVEMCDMPSDDDVHLHPCCVRMRLFNAEQVSFDHIVADGFWSDWNCLNNTEEVSSFPDRNDSNVVIVTIVFAIVFIIVVCIYLALRLKKFCKDFYKPVLHIPASLVQIMTESDASYLYPPIARPREELERFPCPLDLNNFEETNFAEEIDTSFDRTVESGCQAVASSSDSAFYDITTRSSEWVTFSETDVDDTTPNYLYVCPIVIQQSHDDSRRSSASSVFDCTYEACHDERLMSCGNVHSHCSNNASEANDCAFVFESSPLTLKRPLDLSESSVDNKPSNNEFTSSFFDRRNSHFERDFFCRSSEVDENSDYVTESAALSIPFLRFKHRPDDKIVCSKASETMSKQSNVGISFPSSDDENFHASLAQTEEDDLTESTLSSEYVTMAQVKRLEKSSDKDNHVSPYVKFSTKNKDGSRVLTRSESF